jgi:antirestriction protein ArdC
MTFKQAIELGACVRKGEHGTPVFFVSALEREEPNAKGELVERHIPFWKSFTVFNIAQVDGLPARLPVAPGRRSNGLRVSTHILLLLVQPSASVAIAPFTHPRPIR